MIKGLRASYSSRFYLVDEFGFIYCERGGDSVERIYIDVMRNAPVLL